MLFSGCDSSEYTSRQPSHTVIDRYHWKSPSSADSDEKRTLKKPKFGTPERDALALRATRFLLTVNSLNTIIGVCRRQREDGSDVDDLFSQHLRQASGQESNALCPYQHTSPNAGRRKGSQHIRAASPYPLGSRNAAYWYYVIWDPTRTMITIVCTIP